MTEVLLVDDEEVFVNTMVKRLTKRGLTVLKALSGEEGLSRLSENNNVDVVILDVKMPGLDGIETLCQIKAEYPLVEVIMLTGHATVETAIDGMREGAFDYLLKPCDMDELMGKINEAVNRRNRRKQEYTKFRVNL